MGQGEKRYCWSDIQQELLEEILRKLTLVDYLKCRRVCRSWRRIVKDALATKGTCPPAPQFPFLMLFPSNFDRNQPATLLDITQDTPYTIPTQTWKGGGYSDFKKVFSVQGWLVFQNVYYDKIKSYDSILFSNPMSGEEFELPRLPLFPGYQDFTNLISVKLVFSSAPPNFSDFFVVACATLHQCPSMQRLAFCKVADKKWTIIRNHHWYKEFIILDGKLYATYKSLSLSGFVTLYNLRDSNFISFDNLKLEPIPKGEPFPINGLQYNEECMLAKDGDEILLVVHDKRPLKFIETEGFRVFKLDICGSKWIEVDDLGDHVLLMDSAGIQVISAKEIDLPNNLSGGNCVLYWISNYIRVFNLKDKRITHFPLSRHCLQASDRRFLWFMPNSW